MSLKMGPILLPSYKQEWEKTMAQRYKDGNFPSSGPDCFEAWLSERVYSLRGMLDYTERKAAETSREVRKYKKQRNIAVVLSVIWLAIALLFALRPAPVQQVQDETAAEVVQSDTLSFAEWSRRRKCEYVASSGSSKYHRRSCDYADNILEENRVYYETPADAERDGKYACSVCRP